MSSRGKFEVHDTTDILGIWDHTGDHNLKPIPCLSSRARNERPQSEPQPQLSLWGGGWGAGCKYLIDGISYFLSPRQVAHAHLEVFEASSSKMSRKTEKGGTLREGADEDIVWYKWYTVYRI